MLDFSSNNYLLKSGLKVRTKFNNSTTWIPNIIDDVNRDIISIPVVEEYDTDQLINEDSIVIEFFDENYLYKIDGKILDIDIVNTQIIVIKIINLLMHENERTSERYYINFEANVSSPSRGIACAANISNISLGGVSFSTNHEFSIGEIVSIDVLLENKKVVTISGNILRQIESDKGYQYAVKLDKNEETMSGMQELINEIENKSKIAQQGILSKKADSYLNSKILLIEPSNLIRMIVKSSINNVGIANVFDSSSAQDATQKIQSIKPDIVCMSYVVYLLEDQDIINKLYKSNPSVKIIFLSSTPRDEMDPVTLIKYKIDYISKTTNYDKLVEAIRNYNK